MALTVAMLEIVHSEIFLSLTKTYKGSANVTKITRASYFDKQKRARIKSLM